MPRTKSVNQTTFDKARVAAHTIAGRLGHNLLPFRGQFPERNAHCKACDKEIMIHLTASLGGYRIDGPAAITECEGKPK